MNKNLLVIVGVAALAVYLVMSFLGKLQTTDELSTSQSRQEQIDQSHYRKDAIGQTILYFKGEPFSTKFEIWQRSPLHQEFFNLFPNFMGMKEFINDRVLDDEFQEKMGERIDEIETGYFSGKLDEVRAKEMLENF